MSDGRNAVTREGHGIICRGGKSVPAVSLPATETIIQLENPVDQLIGQFHIPDFQEFLGETP